jgi:transposase
MGRVRSVTQDSRRLRRNQRCWIVERFFAKMQWHRRLLTRWKFYPTNFLGFVQLGAICILLKQFLDRF